MIRITDTHVLFYTEWLSNFFRANFEYKGIMFFCSEQAFMWEKAMFFGDTETAKKILAAYKPDEAMRLGHEVKPFSREKWEPVRYQVMHDVNFAKYSQNPDLAARLCSYKYYGRTFVEASPIDNVWGSGIAKDEPDADDETKWTGRNLLGKVLTQVRDELLPEYGRTDYPIKGLHEKENRD